MKKNISINIGGIIFHIEEDGYETLKRYLDSIKKYFSTFDDSSEILADIESRIAEIFLSKLNEGKQVIIAEDVNALITTMGSVSDFKAAEAQEYTATEPEANVNTDAGQTHTTGASAFDNTSTAGGNNTGYKQSEPRRLFRDQKRKVLGGVCSGIGNYFRVDSLWVRLLFVILAFATFGTAVFIYVVMWIFVPGSYELDEAQEKKMYRDPERKVIGGVCGGVAAYLGIDIVLVRILFVLTTFVGFLGGIIYIVLWVIVPEARSLTERMQMQGEPLTLSNIESTIKRNLEGGDATEESALTRIILFPFRLLGILLTALGKIIVPLFELLRVTIGVLIILTGVGFILTTLIGGATIIGMSTAVSFPWDWNNQMDMNLPMEALTKAVPTWLGAVAFITAVIPSVFLILLGVSITARKMVFNPTVGWSLFALFFVCAVMLTVGITQSIYAFKETGDYKVENTYEPTGKKVHMKINEVGLDGYNGARLVLKGHVGKEFRLVQFFEAHGHTRQKAIENASMVTYNVTQADSSFVFDSNITFKHDAIFREQRLNMTLYIPYNKPFTMENGFSRFISQYVDHDNRDDHTWIMTEKKGLECVDCPVQTETESQDNEPSVFADDNQQDSDLRDFDELDLRGVFDVRIHRGDEFRVELNGSESEKKRYTIYRAGQTLVIEFDGKKNFKWDKIVNDEIRVNITMPELKKLDAMGSGTIRFDEFTTTDIEIDIKGTIKARGDLNAEDVILSLNGKAELDLSGKANKLNADIEFNSKLKAYNFEVNDAIIEAKGSSTARVNVTNSLEMEERSGSNIDHRGNPKIITRN